MLILLGIKKEPLRESNGEQNKTWFIVYSETEVSVGMLTLKGTAASVCL